MNAIAQRDRETGETRSLIGHSLDVTLAARQLLQSPALTGRLSHVAGLLERFPYALCPAPAMRWTPDLDHLFAGLVMLADWMGSSLPVTGPDFRPEAVADLLATLPWSGGASGAEPLSILPGAPMGAQTVIGDAEDRLVIVEAPTGTGKTETAVLHALRLMNRGEIDGFYFAVPTRSAATELHERIAALVGLHSPDLKGRVVRAVPGQLDTDLWQRDTPSWAIGSGKRIMAASVAVGTIDQAMLSVLRARHAWMRHAALSRLCWWWMRSTPPTPTWPRWCGRWSASMCAMAVRC